MRQEWPAEVSLAGTWHNLPTAEQIKKQTSDSQGDGRDVRGPAAEVSGTNRGYSVCKRRDTGYA